MAWGRPPSCTCGTCRKCKHAAYMREWYRRKTPEQRRAWRATRDPEIARAHSRAVYHRQKGDPEFRRHRAAVSALNEAIEAGRITRGACERCGASDAQAHHDDYSKPLDVRWLCPAHHAAEHNPEAVYA